MLVIITKGNLSIYRFRSNLSKSEQLNEHVKLIIVNTIIWRQVRVKETCYLLSFRLMTFLLELWIKSYSKVYILYHYYLLFLSGIKYLGKLADFKK